MKTCKHFFAALCSISVSCCLLVQTTGSVFASDMTSHTDSALTSETTGIFPGSEAVINTESIETTENTETHENTETIANTEDLENIENLPFTENTEGTEAPVPTNPTENNVENTESSELPNVLYDTEALDDVENTEEIILPETDTESNTELKVSESLKTTVIDGYQVINVSADAIASSNCSTAIQKALDTAKANASASQPYKIIVEPGSYNLTTGLRIYSNTYLSLQDVILTQAKNQTANMLKIGDNNDTSTGYFYENITIDSGIWDENGNSNTAIKMCHAKNVTLMNATLKNCKNSHLIETAGVDGLTIQNCSFSDQLLSVNATPYTYEAIQLDILLQSHISGYLSEALPLRNVTITGCNFTNVPRGVGSHTAMLNLPVDTITISNNTFTNLKSLAIQAMNYINCTISNNTITGTPQGIMVYSVRESGTFLPSTAALEGGIPTSAFSGYTTPSMNQNVNILQNNIALTGKDPYEKYENTAIFVSGLNLSSAVQGSGDKIPAGDYFMSGVTVSENTINTDGHGIRLQNVKTSSIANNNINYTAASSKTYYGIQLRDGTTNGSIQNNILSNPVSGIHVYKNSSASCIAGNTINHASANSIMIEKATAQDITGNTITSPGKNGIFIYDDAVVSNLNGNHITGGTANLNIDTGVVTTVSDNTFDGASGNSVYLHNQCNVTAISGNTILNTGKHGVFVEESTLNTLENNIITSPAKNGIHVYQKSKISKLVGNTITSAGNYGIAVENSTAGTIKKNTISKPANTGICVYKKGTAKKITTNTITSGKDCGIIVSSLKNNLAITSNTIKKCKKLSIYSNPGSASYTITISQNKITGSGKKANGILCDSGKLVITGNTIKTCNYAVVLASDAKGTIKPNKFSGNKYNKISINSQHVPTLKTTKVSFGTVTKTSVKIKWKKVSSASGYMIYRSKSKDGTYKKCGTVTKGDTLILTDKKVKKGTTYYYKVVAYKKMNNNKITVYGSTSAPKKIKTK